MITASIAAFAFFLLGVSVTLALARFRRGAIVVTSLAIICAGTAGAFAVVGSRRYDACATANPFPLPGTDPCGGAAPLGLHDPF